MLKRLSKEKKAKNWQRMVREVVENEPLDRRLLGEALPPGLRLLG